MVGVRLTEIWFKCWMVALVRLRHEWDFFLTFENNYRVYWAWTKYCICAAVGQISRPNHQPDPGLLSLADSGRRIKWEYWSVLATWCLCWFTTLQGWRRGTAHVRRRTVCCVLCGRTILTLGHGNLSFSSTLYPVPAFSPHHTLYRVTTQPLPRWEQTIQD